jgi:hypothetical protein
MRDQRDQRDVLVIKRAFLAQAYNSNASQVKSSASKMSDVVNRFSLKRRYYTSRYCLLEPPIALRIDDHKVPKRG